MERLTLEQFRALEVSEKIPYLSKDGDGDEIFHVLFAQQFNRRGLDALCALADHIRKINKTKEGSEFLRNTLADMHALNLFVQPSTRTFMSFYAAEQKLGMMTLDIRDVTTSSQAKGESFRNSIRTFSSYVDLIVMRHPDKGACEVAAWEMNMAERRVPVLNGGSGRDQHPTQAVLDIYTIQKSVNKRDGKTIVMVGDLARGRTVRSLSYLLKNYEGVRIVYVAPEHLRIGDDIKDFLRRQSMQFEETESLEEVIPEADAIYMTRVQGEWDKQEGGSTGEKSSSDPHFVFKKEYLARMKKTACLMHPLPKINEIDGELDYIDDPRVVYWRQERNGMWARAALIATVFGVHTEISEFQAD